jgi:hypothetical protein
MKHLHVWVGVLFTVLLAFALALPADAQQPGSQPLTLVVRDGQGNPLPGVALDILVEGPPHEPYDNCATDASGECRLMIPPGSYVVQFTRGWQGYIFVPAGQQNAGALEDGTSGGGFGITFDPSTSPQVVTFVVGVQDGALVPLWDMSRDPAAPPQPFAMPQSALANPDNALAGISFDALVATPSSTEQPATASAAESQVVTSEILPGAEPTLTVTPVVAPTVVPAGNPSIGSSALLLAIAALLGLVVVILALMLVSRRLRRSWESIN